MVDSVVAIYCYDTIFYGKCIVYRLIATGTLQQYGVIVLHVAHSPYPTVGRALYAYCCFSLIPLGVAIILCIRSKRLVMAICSSNEMLRS